MVNIALFGTSADPPTKGHQQIIIWLSQHFDYVAVWVSDNPFKSHQTPLEHRETMLRLLIEEISPPATNVALHPELSNPRTLITVERARQKWPSAEFTLTIGSDLVTNLPRWYCAQKLLQQVKLLVIPRPGYAVKEEDIELLRSLGAQVAIAPVFTPAVSSTQFRKCTQTEALTPPILSYIHREQLYACREVN